MELSLILDLGIIELVFELLDGLILLYVTKELSALR
jgi:hypothetical protein